MRIAFLILSCLTLICTVSCNSAPESQTDVVEQEAPQTKPAKVLSVKKFKQKMIVPGAQLVDVRSDGEVEEGMIENATQMNISDWETFVTQTESLDKTKPVLVYCKRGGRSAKAADYLSKNGFEVYDLDGGYDAWSSEK